jgi:uncharacterized membrane protein YeiH
MSLLYSIDLIGTFVFAISGVLTAVDKKFDVVGASVIGMVTAIGGGSLRDVLIGQTPVGWMRDTNYVLIIFAAMPVCYFFLQTILKLRRSIFLFDTIGIGLFTILGVQKTLSIGLSPVIAVLMGIVSAVFGGVIRDVLCNEVPLIFRKEVYATACLAGAVTYVTLNHFFARPMIEDDVRFFIVAISISVVIVIRILAVIKKWSLPFNPKM